MRKPKRPKRPKKSSKLSTWQNWDERMRIWKAKIKSIEDAPKKKEAIIKKYL